MTDENVKTISWNDEHNSIMLIDQTKLPVKFVVLEITTVERLADAIRRLEVRGAPPLGVAWAFGVALSALSCTADIEFAETVATDAALMKSTQSTAVNLALGIDKVLRAMENLKKEMAKFLAVTAAKTIATEEEICCILLGHNGAPLLPQIGTVLTHYCNAGALACSTWGTTLGVIRSSCKMGKKISIIDSEAAYLMRHGKTWQQPHLRSTSMQVRPTLWLRNVAETRLQRSGANQQYRMGSRSSTMRLTQHRWISSRPSSPIKAFSIRRTISRP